MFSPSSSTPSDNVLSKRILPLCAILYHLSPWSFGSTDLPSFTAKPPSPRGYNHYPPLLVTPALPAAHKTSCQVQGSSRAASEWSWKPAMPESLWKVAACQEKFAEGKGIVWVRLEFGGIWGVGIRLVIICLLHLWEGSWCCWINLIALQSLPSLRFRHSSASKILLSKAPRL